MSLQLINSATFTVQSSVTKYTGIDQPELPKLVCAKDAVPMDEKWATHWKN